MGKIGWPRPKSGYHPHLALSHIWPGGGSATPISAGLRVAKAPSWAQPLSRAKEREKKKKFWPLEVADIIFKALKNFIYIYMAATSVLIWQLTWHLGTGVEILSVPCVVDVKIR